MKKILLINMKCMKFLNRITFFVMMVLAVAIVAAGCGSGGNGSTASDRESINKTIQSLTMSLQITCGVMDSVSYAPVQYAYAGDQGTFLTDLNAMNNAADFFSTIAKYGVLSGSGEYVYSEDGVDKVEDYWDGSHMPDLGYPTAVGNFGSGTISLTILLMTNTINQTFTVSGSCSGIPIYPRYQLFSVFDANGNKISADLDDAGNVITPVSSKLTITLPSGVNQCVSGQTITFVDSFFTTTSKSITSGDIINSISPGQLVYFSYSDQPVSLNFGTVNTYDIMSCNGYGYCQWPEIVSPGQSFQMPLMICNDGSLASGTYQEKITIYDPDVDFDGLNMRAMTDTRLPIFAETVVPFTLIVP